MLSRMCFVLIPYDDEKLNTLRTQRSQVFVKLTVFSIFSISVFNDNNY
jgi:hypothetical protein